MRIVPRSMCVVPEAGGSVCPLWYEAYTAKLPIIQRSVFVLLDVGRKRRFGKQQQSRGNSFCEYFFSLFLLSHTERTRFGRCGLLVERHSDQPKQVARLVPCCMYQMQPGNQCWKPLRRSCCASIAIDDSASQEKIFGRRRRKIFCSNSNNNN